MPRGISTNKRTTNQTGCLQSQGIAFVCRYYSAATQQPQKRLVLAEAQAIVAAGMGIVTVYEDKPTSGTYFTYSRGMQDAVAAHGYAQGIGQPAGCAIYFAVDYDATPAETQGPISHYFQGVKDGLEHAAGDAVQYEVGVYGSGRVCGWIKEQTGLARYSWLAESHGWADHGVYTSPDIRQEVADHAVCGLAGGVGGDYEDNFADGEFGAFFKLNGGALASMAAGAGTSSQPAAGGTSTPLAAMPSAVANVGGAAGGYVHEVVAKAQGQFEQYHQYTENDPPLRVQIRHYWEDIGFVFPGVSTPWSAVFVSWIMRESGASKDEFKASTAHSRFVYWAIQNKRSGVGVFRAYRLSEYAPKIGDIIQNNRGGQTLTYDFAAAHEAYESHSAVVVEVGSDAAGRYALTVGGNESDSVGKKRVALDGDGLIRQRSANSYICVVQNLKT